MKYLIAQIPLIATLLATLKVFSVLERIYQLKPSSVSFKSPKTEVAMASFPYLILVAFTTFAFWRTSSQKTSEEESVPRRYTLRHALLQLLASALTLLPFGIAMLLRRQNLKTIGASRHNLSASVIGGLVASVIASLIRGRLSFSFWLSALTIYRLIAQLGVGFSEEAIFRGYLLTRFSAQFKRTTAELLAAGMFAVVHIPQRLFKKSTAKELIVDLSGRHLLPRSGVRVFHHCLNY
jgi:membrane protease YdiL (CAAX protease family)